MSHGATIGEAMPRRSQKADFLSQKRNGKKERRARKESLRQRELGYRDGIRLAKSILEMAPEERESLGIRLRPSLTEENLSRSLRYLSKDSPEYKVTKILQETLRDKKESGEDHVSKRTGLQDQTNVNDTKQ